MLLDCIGIQFPSFLFATISLSCPSRVPISAFFSFLVSMLSSFSQPQYSTWYVKRAIRKVLKVARPKFE
jgi:hypothetical protein